MVEKLERGNSGWNRINACISTGEIASFRCMEQAVMTPLTLRNMEGGSLKPKKWESVSVICMDIVDYTYMSGSMVSEAVCKMLTKFYERLDALSEEHHVDKIDIIGDAYVALSESATNAVRFCLDAIALAGCTMWDETDPAQGTIMLRCAVHTGAVVGLVINSASFKYTLVGDTMVRAKRMEGMAVPGSVHCSDTTAAVLDDTEFSVVFHTVQDPSTYTVTWADVNRKTVVCPISLRFMSVSDRFVELFGYRRRELTSLRMVYGPDTHAKAIQLAMDQCFQFDYSTRTVVMLYDKAAHPVCTAMEFERSEDVSLGVDMQCEVHQPSRRVSRMHFREDLTG